MLNTANYKTVWNDNFTQGAMPSNMGVVWGNADEFSYSNQGLALTSDGSATGFLTADTSAASGNGYGLYQITFTAPEYQANGAYICLWPGSNVWPGPELDFFEQLNGQAYMTVHWEGAGDSNQYQSYDYTVNSNNSTTLAMDWEKGSLTFYVNGQELVEYKAGGAVPIPNDYADGGENEAFGVGNVGPSGVTLTISDMSYSTPTTTSSGITLSAPGTVQEASKGAGVNVTETVSAPGLSTIYEAVFTSANVAETGWTAVSLTNGAGSFTAHFAQSGDYVEAVNSISNATITGTSGQVTITDVTPPPPASIDVSSPGTVREASVGAGVNVTETLTAPGLSTVYAAVFTSANVAEENWITVALNSSGVGSFSAHFEHSGDYIVAVNSTSSATIEGWSTPVTITDTAATKPTNIALTGDNLAANSPVGTVIGTLSATDPASLSYALVHAPNGLFAISGNELVLNHALPAKAPASYLIEVQATDSNGGTAGKFISVGVAAAKAAVSARVAAAAPVVVADHATVLAGTGATITPGSGASDTVSFGAGYAAVLGGSGADHYVYHADSGFDLIREFNALQGDTLTIDHALQPALHETSVGGASLLSFGDPSHGILLAGMANFAASQIHWG